MPRRSLAAALSAGLLSSLCVAVPAGAADVVPPRLQQAAAAPDARAMLETYADLGLAMYGDATAAAEGLKQAIDAFLAKPDDGSLKAAREAWRAARVPYMQTEGFRFGNPEVDALEGNVNSWPLDEGLIDYVDPSYGDSSDSNPLYRLDVIANPQLQIGKDKVDATRITKALLTSLQGAAGSETNVAIGYHAIEFLLWGQDLNGTGPGAGNRPASDYDLKACTHGNCDRRAAYLAAAADLLVEDLGRMAALWGADGAARKRLLAGEPDAGLTAMLTGLGSLSYGELAGERTKLGLMLHDPEEEQDCFSDNTHNAHFYDERGIVEIYEGRYTRLDGSVVSGASLRDYVAARDPAAGARVAAAMAAATAAMQTLKDTADSGRMAYDQMIGPDNPEGNAIVQHVVDTLVAQAHAIEGAVAALGLTIKVEGSESLDDPGAVTP
jgi:putative iron-regulated protein